MAELIGTQLGEYLVEGAAGDGRGGRLLRARHAGLNRPVTILAIDPQLSAAPDFDARFSAMLQELARLDHPHIPHIYDSGVQSGQYYIVGERLSGVTAASLVRRRAESGRLLPLSGALDLARQAAEALAYAHALDVAHGAAGLDVLHFESIGALDTRPAPALKLAGWEQARLQPGRALSPRDDVLALGAAIYELCTGRPLDDARSPQLAADVIRPGLPGGVASLIAQCLQRDPDLRPSAAEVAARLDDAIQELQEARDGVQATPAVDLDISPRRAAGHDEATYQVTIGNADAAPGRFWLSAADETGELEFSLVQEEVILEPGQRARVALFVRAPRRYVGSARARRFEVAARAHGGPAQVAAAEFVHQTLISPWILLAGSLLLLLVVFLSRDFLGGTRVGQVAVTPPAVLEPTEQPTPTAAPGAPVVNLFAVEPQVVLPDGEVVVAWDVRGADRVVIDQFGDVPPSGQRQHRPGQTTDYRLTAFGGGQEALRIERVSVVTPTPAPTAVPTAEPPTPAPPTAEPPTAEPPTAEPPTVAVPGQPAGPFLLIDAAPSARWEVNGQPIRFGSRLGGADRASADLASDVVLEDGQRYPATLVTNPGADLENLLEGQFSVPTIGPGQSFVADVALAQETVTGAALVEVRFSGEIIAREVKSRDGSLLRIRVDLQPFAGRSGRLDLRVSRAEGMEPAAAHWVNPRIEGPLP